MRPSPHCHQQRASQDREEQACAGTGEQDEVGGACWPLRGHPPRGNTETFPVGRGSWHSGAKSRHLRGAGKVLRGSEPLFPLVTGRTAAPRLGEDRLAEQREVLHTGVAQEMTVMAAMSVAMAMPSLLFIKSRWVGSWPGLSAPERASLERVGQRQGKAQKVRSHRSSWVGQAGAPRPHDPPSSPRQAILNAVPAEGLGPTTLASPPPEACRGARLLANSTND